MRSKSVPLGGVATLPRPRTATNASLLCGANLHLPAALSLNRLTKPNHLPLNKTKLKNNLVSLAQSCKTI